MHSFETHSSASLDSTGLEGVASDSANSEKTENMALAEKKRVIGGAHEELYKLRVGLGNPSGYRASIERSAERTKTEENLQKSNIESVQSSSIPAKQKIEALLWMFDLIKNNGASVEADLNTHQQKRSYLKALRIPFDPEENKSLTIQIPENNKTEVGEAARIAIKSLQQDYVSEVFEPLEKKENPKVLNHSTVMDVQKIILEMRRKGIDTKDFQQSVAKKISQHIQASFDHATTFANGMDGLRHLALLTKSMQKLANTLGNSSAFLGELADLWDRKDIAKVIYRAGMEIRQKYREEYNGDDEGLFSDTTKVTYTRNNLIEESKRNLSNWEKFRQYGRMISDFRKTEENSKKGWLKKIFRSKRTRGKRAYRKAIRKIKRDGYLEMSQAYRASVPGTPSYTPTKETDAEAEERRKKIPEGMYPRERRRGQKRSSE